MNSAEDDDVIVRTGVEDTHGVLGPTLAGGFTGVTRDMTSGWGITGVEARAGVALLSENTLVFNGVLNAGKDDSLGPANMSPPSTAAAAPDVELQLPSFVSCVDFAVSCTDATSA